MPRTRTAYRDTSGRVLGDYPRPSVAVDTAVLTLADEQLCVVLTMASDSAPGANARWRLPGTFLHVGETLADAVRRSLLQKAGISEIQPRQLHVFDDPDRDERGWVLSVAHLAAVRIDRVPLTDRTRVIPIADVGDLEYDHEAIVEFAADALRAEYRRAPDPARLIADAWPGEPIGSFTVLELRRLHQAVLGETFNADTFRRSMLPALTPTGRWRKGARGKPAELYVRASTT